MASLKSFANSCINLYTMYFALDIKYPFTFDKPNLHQNLEKFDNIMPTIVTRNKQLDATTGSVL